MMSSVTAETKRKLIRCGARWKRGLGCASWNCIPKRRRSCTARMQIDAAATPEQRFDFLGYTFRPRPSMRRDGRLFVSFAPAISDDAAKAMRHRIRRWKLHLRNDLALAQLARWTRPGPARVGALLRAFLSVRTSPRAAHCRPVLSAMGAAQIQTVARPRDARLGLAERGSCPAADFVRTLEPCGHGWTIGAG